MDSLFESATQNATYGYLRANDSTAIHLSIRGNWNGATATVKVSYDGGANYIDFVADGVTVAMTANNKIIIDAGPGERYAVALSSVGASTSLTGGYSGRHVNKVATATG